MNKKINYAESAHRILGTLEKIELHNVENLQSLMDQFEHIRLKDRFVLDAYYSSRMNGGHYTLYARHRDAAEPFVYSAYQPASYPTTKIGEKIDFGGHYEDEEEEEI